MKKLIAVAIVSVLMTSTTFAYTVNLEQMQKEAICQSNAAVLSKECKQPIQQAPIKVKSCSAIVTDEVNGKSQRVDFTLHPDNVLARDSKTTTYQVEDEEGSVTAYLDNKTGKGSVTVMNKNIVTYSGTIDCK